MPIIKNLFERSILFDSDSQLYQLLRSQGPSRAHYLQLDECYLMPSITDNEIRRRSESSQIFSHIVGFLDDPLVFIGPSRNHLAFAWCGTDFGIIVMGERPDGIIPAAERGDGPLDKNELFVLGLIPNKFQCTFISAD